MTSGQSAPLPTTANVPRSLTLEQIISFPVAIACGYGVKYVSLVCIIICSSPTHTESIFGGIAFRAQALLIQEDRWIFKDE